MKNLLTVALTTSIVACGGGGSKTPDAFIPPQHDAPNNQDAPPDTASVNCTTTALGPQDIIQASDGMAAVWGGDVTTDLGDGAAAQQYFIQFYHFSGTDLTMPIDLTSTVQADFATCDACIIAGSFDDQGNLLRTYFQSGGTVTLTADPVDTNNMMGTITGLAMTEVTIDDQSHSMPVAGGKCIMIGDVTLNHDAVPNAWTCAHTAFGDGASCDCMCGLSDPDCATVANPVVGCTGTQVCPDDACHDRATNDTCATATTLTVGTPANGTSFGATSNYDSGLEGAACTGFAQPGPDVAFKVALTAGTSYTVALTNAAPGNFDASISIVGPTVNACNASPLVCLAGADAGLGGDGETFTYQPTATGNYFVIVDTYDGQSAGGSFTIEVTSP